MLKADGLKKIFGDRLVIRDVSFETAEHGIYGFLGPNGAGKSTTMNMITGYLAPDGGDVLVGGYSMIRDTAKAKRMIGFLPEQPPLYQDMTVGEYLRYIGELKGIRRKLLTNEISRVLTRLDIKYVKNRLIRQLSKGYKQRVGLAQAILADPPVIILDEPSSGLDPRQNSQMRELVKELGKEHTVMLSTHVLSEITEICDCVMILSGGRIVANDTPEELLKTENESQKLKLVLKGNASAAERTLLKLKTVESHRILAEDGESTTVEVVSFPGEDAREEISMACISNDYVILELYRDKLTLEEVYLKLTQEAED